MTQGLVGIVMAAKHLLRLAPEMMRHRSSTFGGIIGLTNRAAGKNIKAAEKSHPPGRRVRENLKTAGHGRTRTTVEALREGTINGM